MRRDRVFLFATAVLMSMMACSFGAQQGSGRALATASEVAGAPEPTSTGTIGEAVLPVPFNEGLASLESYRLTYTNDVYDSVADQRSVLTVISARDGASDATYTSTESRTTTEGDEVITSSFQEQYSIGNGMCVLQEGQAQFTETSDMARTVMELFSRAVTINPIIENPVYTGDDVIGGIPVHVYQFEVRSVGATSEAEVSTADGHYAVAVDGHYLVDYRLDLELRTGQEGDPQAEFSVSFFEINVTDINEPVEISFPAACQEASQLGPEQDVE